MAPMARLHWMWRGEERRCCYFLVGGFYFIFVLLLFIFWSAKSEAPLSSLMQLDVRRSCLAIWRLLPLLNGNFDWGHHLLPLRADSCCEATSVSPEAPHHRHSWVPDSSFGLCIRINRDCCLRCVCSCLLQPKPVKFVHFFYISEVS